jgi:hypothetical protein
MRDLVSGRDGIHVADGNADHAAFDGWRKLKPVHHQGWHQQYNGLPGESSLTAEPDVHAGRCEVKHLVEIVMPVRTDGPIVLYAALADRLVMQVVRAGLFEKFAIKCISWRCLCGIRRIWCASVRLHHDDRIVQI